VYYLIILVHTSLLPANHVVKRCLTGGTRETGKAKGP
jgi:hypothetical protein